jgi:hypothetical protein
MVRCLEFHHGQHFAAYNGDCVDVLRQFPSDSIDFSIYSPPFSNLFVYSDSIADMGNAASDEEFLRHYEFLLEELFRLTLPGRLSAVHCSDLPASKSMHGYIGIRDLSGDLIRAHLKSGGNNILAQSRQEIAK